MKLGMSPSIVWLMGPHIYTLSPGLLLWASSAFLLPLVLPSNPSDHLPLNPSVPILSLSWIYKDEPIIGTEKSHLWGQCPKAPAEPAVSWAPLTFSADKDWRQFIILQSWVVRGQKDNVTPENVVKKVWCCHPSWKLKKEPLEKPETRYRWKDYLEVECDLWSWTPCL